MKFTYKVYLRSGTVDSAASTSSLQTLVALFSRQALALTSYRVADCSPASKQASGLTPLSTEQEELLP